MNNYIPYPYPVLGNADDVDGHFIPSMTYSLDPINVALNIKFDLKNDYFKQLLSEKQASFLIDITCSKTYYRKSIRTNDYSVMFNELSQNLRGKVDVSFYVCTNGHMSNYSPTGEPHYVEAGDIIAVGGSTSFVAEKEYDPLKAPIKSFIKITKIDKPQDEFTMLYKDEFITICIPDDMWSLYEGARGSAAEMLHASIVFPALMDAIDTIKGGKNAEFANSSWAVKLKELCDSRNIDMDSDTYIIAQKLLNNPVKRALDWYDKEED